MSKAREQITKPSDELCIDGIDKVWEAFNPYEERKLDALILTHAQFEPDDSYGMLNKEEKDASLLLKERYNELVEQDRVSGIQGINSDYRGFRSGTPDNSRWKKVERIRDEWMRRYFLPRVEELDPQDFESFLHAKIVGSDLKNAITPAIDTSQIVKSVDGNPHQYKYYRVLADLEMVPLYGSRAVRLLVPPNVEVSGRNFGHSEVMRWSELEAKDVAYKLLQEKIGNVARRAEYLETRQALALMDMR